MAAAIYPRNASAYAWGVVRDSSSRLDVHRLRARGQGSGKEYLAGKLAFGQKLIIILRDQNFPIDLHITNILHRAIRPANAERVDERGVSQPERDR